MCGFLLLPHTPPLANVSTYHPSVATWATGFCPGDVSLLPLPER